MAGGEYDFLRTRPEDVDFHSSRIMFWVVGEDIVVAPQRTPKSHLEMAEAEKWINGENTQEFFQRNMRGFRLKSEVEDRIHFYIGVGFEFDDEVVALATRMLPRFVETLGLRPETKVFFGPKDSLINGIEYPIQFGGTVGQILSEGQ